MVEQEGNMILKLTQQEAQRVEIAALQKLVQDKLQNMIEKRAAEMAQELGTTFEEYTIEELTKKFRSVPIVDTAAGFKGLLVPVGTKFPQNT